MDLSSLEILIAAIEEKSLSRGAERVHLVTSAVSKRITELERRLGTTLLRRHGRGVEATPAGAMPMPFKPKWIIASLPMVSPSFRPTK